MGRPRRRRRPRSGRAGGGERRQSRVDADLPAAAAETEQAEPRVRPARRAALLFLLCVLVYNANFRATGSLDSLAAGLIPFGIWQGHGVYLDHQAERFPPGVRYSMIHSRQGRWVSLYPIVTPLLVTPLYFPAAFVSWFDPADPVVGTVIHSVMEKLAASLLAALSVVFIYLALRRTVSEWTSLWLALAYAFGTSTWMISSQALWQHGTAELLLAASLYLLVREDPFGWNAALLGLTTALMTANRPQNIFFSAAIAWIVLRRSGRRSWPFWAMCAAVAMVLVAYNLYFFPTVLGGYAEWRLPSGEPLRAALPRPAYLFGQLFSNRGLFVFSPFLLAAFFDRWRPGREREERAVLVAACFASALLYAAYGWSGGYTYGPRYLTDCLPILMLLAARPVDWLCRRPWGLSLLTVAMVFSVALQAIGAFCYPAGDSGNELHGAWTIDRSSPILALRSGPATPHFLRPLAPSLGMHDPLTAEDARMEMSWQEPLPQSWTAAASDEAAFCLRNESGKDWSSLGGSWGMHAVRLVVRWDALEPAGAPPVQTDFWLDANLSPGEEECRTISPLAPAAAGRYRLTIEPGQFNGGRFVLFSEYGAKPLTAEVAVRNQTGG
ncbi:MAG TPA: hypothetical protein VF756_18070 [Thermoanaerobaculia bacterium]